MSSNTNRLLADAGKIQEVGAAFTDSITAIGGKGRHLERTLKDGKLRDRLASLVVDDEDFPVFDVPVDYSQSAKAMLQAGHFGWYGWDITNKNFPVTGGVKANLKIKLFAFKQIEPSQMISFEDAMEELDYRSLTPVAFSELLAFSLAHPDVQRKQSIAGLGSSFVDSRLGRLVPVLTGNHLGRQVYCYQTRIGWDRRWSFAVVEQK